MRKTDINSINKFTVGDNNVFLWYNLRCCRNWLLIGGRYVISAVCLSFVLSFCLWAGLLQK